MSQVVKWEGAQLIPACSPVGLKQSNARLTWGAVYARPFSGSMLRNTHLTHLGQGPGVCTWPSGAALV